MTYIGFDKEGFPSRFGQIFLMKSIATGMVTGMPAFARPLATLAVIVGLPALAACTTIEGTNALVDPQTFEREVMDETLKGIGVIDRQTKPELQTPRAPLVLPDRPDRLPAPTQRTAQLPEDSDTAQIDLAGISEEQLQRLRNARVVDLRSLSGRPLTEAEARQLTARMTADRLAAGSRPLYLPPDSYFTTINNQDLVCLAPSGELVPLDDPRCPEAIRKALQTN